MSDELAPTAEAPTGLSPIAAASANLRAQAATEPAAPVIPTEAPDTAPSPVPPTDGQPRNPDGTFAPKQPAEGEAADPAAAAPPADPDAADPNAAPDPDPNAAEPRLFTLKGEEQRGEADLELDITGLPPEAVERLERLAKQGMRRAEFDQSMRKVRTERADLDAVETEITVDPTGFVLNRVPPVRRQELAQTLLIEQFEALAPMIQELWENPSLRYAKLDEVRQTVESRRTNVVATVQASREAAAVRAAVGELIPDTASEQDAQEFFASAIALLQPKALAGERVAPDTVPAMLDAHRRRFFGAGPAAAPTPPARPRLAVRTTPTPTGPQATAPTLTSDQVAAQIRARQAAAAVAPVGAGAAAVQQPGPAKDETIEQVSRRLRGLPPR